MDIDLWLKNRIKKNKKKAICAAINLDMAKHWKREWNRYKLSVKRKKLGSL